MKDDYIEQRMTEEEARKFAAIQREFLESYAAAKDTMPIEEWFFQEMQRQMPEQSSQKIHEMSNEILESLRTTESKKESLQKAISSGRSKESWLASVLMQSTSQMSVHESTEYLKGLDEAVKDANHELFEAITTKSGTINQNPNLDGFIAEQHHVNSYNLNAQAAGTGSHAEVLKPKPGENYQKNSVDAVIKDASGRTVSRYQMKYGKTAEDTIRMIQKGDYRGQQLIVPEEQVEAVRKAFPGKKVSATIGDEKVSSTPLTKQEAKIQQEKAQQGKSLDVDWSQYAAKDIALGIGKQAGHASIQGALIGAGMTVAGKVLNDEPIDGGEVIEAAVISGADFGVKAAAAGALKTAVEKDVIKVIPKGTPAAVFANIAFVAVENAKVFGKVFSGELTAKEGLDAMQQTTVSCVAGLAASAKGAAIVGGAVGSVLGPVGAAVGGLVGGAVGYAAGSSLGKAVVKGAQKIRDAAESAAKPLLEKAMDTIETMRNGVTSFFDNVTGFWGSIFG